MDFTSCFIKYGLLCDKEYTKSLSTGGIGGKPVALSIGCLNLE